jgi:hypothetical protein
MYRHVVRAEAGLTRATALCGMRAITLGFDYSKNETKRKDFLGFAIRRIGITDPDETRWLVGQLRFEFQTSDRKVLIGSDQAPFQKFHWGDYGVQPGHRYKYEVYAATGDPEDLPLSLDDAEPAVLDVTTTSNDGKELELYFNRGVTSALAYRAKWEDQRPPDVPNGEALIWLSRGLEEALIAYIDDARGGDTLKVAIYELEKESVLEALRAAKDRGVTVRIAYHAKKNDKRTPLNDHAAKTLKLPKAQLARRTNTKLSHNKFIVHCRGDKPKRVWTGSTNFTDNAVYYQTNVGIIVRDRPVVEAFDDYFELLFRDLVGKDMRIEVASLLEAKGQDPKLFFSPVKSLEYLDVASSLIRDAKDCVIVSAPFSIDQSLADAMNANDDHVLEMALVNKTNFEAFKEKVGPKRNTVIVANHVLARYDGQPWDPEWSMKGHRVHVKCVIADPWSEEPRILFGSSNHSDESVTGNDENNFLIERDTRAAAVFATEFLRMFEHYKIRQFLSDPNIPKNEKPLADTGAWSHDYFVEGFRRNRERAVFMGE